MRVFKVSNKLNGIFHGSNIIWCVVFLFSQQIIVALSTLWIVCLSESIVKNQPFLIYLILFIASLFVVFIPGIYSLIYLEKAKFDSLNDYVGKFIAHFKNYPTLYSDNNFRSKQETWLTNEGQLVINEAFNIAYNWATSTINILFNIMVVGIVISLNLLISYVISFALLSLLFIFSRKNIAHAAESAQINRKSMYQILLSGWDNIVIGNDYNLNKWYSYFSNNFHLARKSAVSLEARTQLFSSLAMAAALLPVVGTIAWLFYINKDNSVLLAALVVTLPRQIQVLQNMHSLASYAFHWHGVKTKLINLMGSIKDIQWKNNEGIISDRIIWGEISINANNCEEKAESMDELLHLVQKNTKGRITIRGKNGSGKSTVVSLIKQILSEKAFYFPVNSNLVFNSFQNNKSTGEKIVSYIEELIENMSEKIIILDEWDANLDTNNLKEISTKIDSLSIKNCVIEIRHRG